MRMYEIIEKKRDNKDLSLEEINYFVTEYTNGNIPDYQVSALLMAIYINGMNKRETSDLTMAMAKSGDMLDLSRITGVKVDKHSTGGVGDKTSLIIGPLAAAAGVPIAKMSGRGLGHTGGTIDKLESIPGFDTEIDMNTFIDNVNNGCIALAGQTGNLVPADKKIYALRDVTATIGDISLIASSIMSKKIAAGSDAIVLDVKVGSGAFMKEIDDSFELAKEMVDIGVNIKRNTVALITNMNQPLGDCIGNSLEVLEAIETLKGNGPKDLQELCLYISGLMIYLGNKSDSIEEGKTIAYEKLKNGQGLEKLRDLIKYQSGDEKILEDYSLFPQSLISEEVVSDSSGYISGIDAEKVGKSAVLLGAGRENKTSQIDYSVGIILNKKVGDNIKAGEKLATIHANDKTKLNQCKELLLSSYSFSDKPIGTAKLVYGLVTKNGIEKF